MGYDEETGNTGDTYAVIGNPIAHSRSPAIHQAFAQQTDQRLDYLRILAPLDQFAATAQQFQRQGGKGFNITTPFKQQAYQLCDEVSADAKLAGAVNTITCQENGKLRGDNTDGIGFIQDLTVNKQFNCLDKTIAILGAGGAVRGILHQLLSQQPRQIIIINRDVAKAQTLIGDFTGPVRSAALTAATSCDLLINATAAGHQQTIPTCHPSLFAATQLVYDLSYGEAALFFLQHAREHGAQHCCGGWGMLVEQAAEAFYIWRGIRPATQDLLTPR